MKNHEIATLKITAHKEAVYPAGPSIARWRVQVIPKVARLLVAPKARTNLV